MSARSAGRFAAAESKFLRPSVWRGKAVGRNTLTDICDSSDYKFGFGFRCGFGFGCSVEFAEVSIEVGEARAYCARIDMKIAVGECVGSLEAVSSDDGNGG